MKFIGGLFTMGVYGFFSVVIFGLLVYEWHTSGLPTREVLRDHHPKTLSRVHASDGALVAEFVDERRFYLPIGEIPPLVRNAFVSAEDQNFYEHAGIDAVAIFKAMVDNVFRFASGRRMRGASTITQQVVKNLVVGDERALARKIREAILAGRLEDVRSKEEILEIYLNEIYFGAGAHGIAEAAQRYFGKLVEELAPEEAAYLAALPKQPNNLHPIDDHDRALDRRNYVLGRMLEDGYITQAQYDDAVDAPLDTILDDAPAEGEEAGPAPRIDYFSEEIRRQLREQYGSRAIYDNGFSIRTTLDRRMQDLARRVLQRRLFGYSRALGYVGPVERLDDVAADGGALTLDGVGETTSPQAGFSDARSWRDRLSALDIPRDVTPWRVAVVLEVTDAGARIGVEGVGRADETFTIAFDDVREWARRRQGLGDDGAPILGPELSGPADVWLPGDVIYVENTNEGGAPVWSMRQIPQVNGALVAMDPHTGRVLAMQGGFSFEASEFNRATQARRQPGSAIKPFIYAVALHNGYQPNTIVVDQPITVEQLDGDPWRPENYNRRFYGPLPLRRGLELSLNLMTVRIAMPMLERPSGDEDPAPGLLAPPDPGNPRLRHHQRIYREHRRL